MTPTAPQAQGGGQGPQQAGGNNPYGITLYTVVTPSGSDLNLQNMDEAVWYEDRRDRYRADNIFTNVSDVQDLDRLLTLEVMVYRWSLWMAQGFDYQVARIDENQLKNNIKEYCLSGDTECLTRRGWKRFIDLIPGEDILTLDTETGLSVWRPLEAVHVYPATGKQLQRIETREISALATGAHRWFVQRDSRKRTAASPWEWRETSELDRYCWAPTAAQHGDFDAHHKQSDSLVELVAWWWTEGSCTPGYYNGEIGQSQTANPTKVAMIRRALFQECGQPGVLKQGALWNETLRDGMVYFNLSKRLVVALEEHAPGRIVSTWFLQQLTQAQLSLFIQRSLDADGWRNSGGGWSIAQRSEERLKAFQVASVLAGYQATMTRNPSIDMWTMNLSERSMARPALRELGIVQDYRGLVWCPQVSTGTWLARRNGRVFYTGNSVEIRLLKQSLGIDKSTRDKEKGESLADYTTKLLQRAKQFGIHRNEQQALIITRFYELRTLVMTYDRCDEEERRLLDLSMESIFEWIRDEVVAKFDEHSNHFRKHQSTWIREM